MRTSKTVTTKTYAIAKHTVTFVADGVTVKTMAVDDGYVLKNSDYPTVPEKSGYIGSWNKYTSPVTNDLTIQASYRLPLRCTVTFKANNVVLKTMTVDEGYMLKLTDYPSIPPKPNYNGMWPSRTSPITTNTTITAVYVPKDGSEIPIPTVPPVVDVASVGDEEEVNAATASVEDTVSATGDNSPAMELVSTATEHHDYIYASGKLLQEVISKTGIDGSVTVEVLDFTYDNIGNPYAMTYTDNSGSSTTYYYITNLQGDVLYLVDQNGSEVSSYQYNAYGQMIVATGSLAEINPLRYRGYYYDDESGFYYLQSRYYDPAICRYINADAAASTGQGFLGCNMFAYCGNNPVRRVDICGCDFFEDAWNWLVDKTEDFVEWVEDTTEDVAEWVVDTTEVVVEAVVDIACDVYDYVTNTDEQVVLDASVIAFYKGRLVIKLPVGDNAASFGIMFIGNGVANRSDAIDVIRHEYGHTVQMNNYGVICYSMFIAVPLIIGNVIDRFDLLPCDYYDQPWEYQANVYGGVSTANQANWAGKASRIYNTVCKVVSTIRRILTIN